MAAFQPSGFVTLTTDFGSREPFVGIMKGVMLSREPRLNIIDLAHEVRAYAPLEAGFWLARAIEHFPAGTVHVAVVDPGVGTRRSIVIARVREQLLVAPDNGLLAALADQTTFDELIRVDVARLTRWQIEARSATFHGRDIIAPLAAELAAGRLQPGEAGEVVQALEVAGYPRPPVIPGGYRGVIVAVDRFGNLISNIPRSAVAGMRNPEARLAGRRLPLHATYGDRAAGELLCLINSFEVLEIAQAQGNAATALGAGTGTVFELLEKA